MVNKRSVPARKRSHSEDLEQKILRLEKWAGIERIEVLRDDTKVAIFHNSVHKRDVVRMIAECEALEASDEAFIVVNLTTIYERFQEWQKKMPRVHPFYAIKCNNDPMITKVIADLGAGFDCASQTEIEMTVRDGLTKPEMVIYANTVKQRSFIREAERYGVRKMTFDNVEELPKMKEMHSCPQLVLRIRADDTTALSNLGVKFGCEPQIAEGLLRTAKDMGLEVIGISFHVGSGCGDASAYAKAIAECAKLFDAGLKMGHQMYFLDLGGGFPGQDTKRITFGQIADAVNPALEKHFPEGKYKGLQIIAEPGRFFGSSPVSLVAHVIGATRVPASRVTGKDEDGEKDGYMYYLNDGVYGSFNSVLWDHTHPQGRALLITKSAIRAGDKTHPSIIWGPTCAGADQINPLVHMRKLTIGDWIFYPHMGSYTRVSASHFNGFHAPKPYYIMDEHTWDAIYGGRSTTGTAAKGAKRAKVDEDGAATARDGDAIRERIDSDIEHQMVSLFE